MAKVTSKRQVTIPKSIADRFRIEAGDELRFEPAGSSIRVRRISPTLATPDIERRLELFDQATERQRGRARQLPRQQERGWSRADLYGRGSAR